MSFSPLPISFSYLMVLHCIYEGSLVPPRTMDSGDLVQNGLEDHSPTMDSANEEAEFKVIAPSVAAEDKKNDDGDLQGSV